MKLKFISIVCLLSFQLGFSQEKIKDTSTVKKMQEVVVTGQFEPQSIKKSVFNVRVITNKDIKNLAAVTLTDVLNQYLNISQRPSGTTGRSEVSLFGLDAQYFKVLVDNVPLVNEAGVGNNIDLSQISLNDIEQIEIVEGSMGVTHGANAVTGILNIITKKSSEHKWSITASAQEETVGKEFEFFDKGRHIQSVSVSHSNDNWFVSVGGNRNDLKGFFDNKKGKNYIENDGLRGYRWLPKEQLNGTAFIGYQKEKFNAFYKIEYFDETVHYFNSTVQSGFNTQLGSYRYSDDKRYLINRFYHNLNSTGKLFSKLNYNISLSHQSQKRSVEDFRYNLNTQKEDKNIIQKDQSMQVIYSTGTVSNFFTDQMADLQLGYEAVNTRGYAMVDGENNIVVPVERTLENYDFFVSSEIKATNKFYVRPGLRFSSQSKFKDQYASSLGLRYLFDSGDEVRASYGNSYRTPTFQELYMRVIFDGHFFIGNDKLIPETSASYELSIKKTSALEESKIQISNSLSGSYLDVNDKIDSVVIGVDSNTGTPQYQFRNISKYRMWNLSTSNQLKRENWSFNLGAALIGVSHKLGFDDLVSDERFLYSFNLNSSVSYTLPKWQTTLSAYYKYNGKTQQFSGSSEFILTKIDASNWLDASIRKSLFKNKLETTIGARNLFDITNVNRTNSSDAGAHATSSQVMLAYGRSYFLKLTYNLNF